MMMADVVSLRGSGEVLAVEAVQLVKLFRGISHPELRAELVAKAEELAALSAQMSTQLWAGRDAPQPVGEAITPRG